MKCNLVLEIITSFTNKILHYKQKKKKKLNGWNYSTKYNDNFRVLFCCHMVSFLLERKKEKKK